jgi:arginyl-tRNA synthetase
MLSEQRSALVQAITQALQPLADGVMLPAILLEQPKDASHGDAACTAALACSKLLKKNPRELAQAIVAALAANPAVTPLVEKVEIAGPGFINFRLTSSAKQKIVHTVLTQGAAFGAGTLHAGQNIMVEFVSANPTGPLHTGHSRQAALGDILCNLLANQGAKVTREFYYNDGGNQIQNLAMSVHARAVGKTPESPDWPADGYKGDYIAEIARDFLAKKTVAALDGAPVHASGDLNDFEGIRKFAVAYLRHEQDLDLQAFGLKFDVFYLESSLYTENRVEQTVQRLKAAGKTFEEGGALWLRTTEYGDDKDRVMQKSDGSGYTYFVPDVAYHVRKFERGFTKVINVQGTDHFGTVARVRAGVQIVSEHEGMGVPKGFPDYVLHSMVKVMRGGQEIKISKRAGSYVTMRDLIDWVGRDAVRYFLVSRKADSEFVFDLDLAVAKNDENPVYYIQYAHARICSVFAESGLSEQDIAGTDLAPLTHERELKLAQRLAQLPDVLAQAATELAPHSVAYWLRDCAAEFHSYYNERECRVLTADEPTKRARLALYAATRQVLARGLAILGMSAPTRMEREDA